MYFTDISYVVHPVGRVTPNGVSLLGTAFFINRRGLLATAAHVTGNNDSGLIVIMNKVNSIWIPSFQSRTNGVNSARYHNWRKNTHRFKWYKAQKHCAEHSISSWTIR